MPASGWPLRTADPDRAAIVDLVRRGLHGNATGHSDRDGYRWQLSTLSITRYRHNSTAPFHAMDKEALNHFRQHYASVPEEELVRLHATRTNLLEEAQVALLQIIAERQVDVAATRASNEAEDKSAAVADNLARERIQKRDAKVYKWFIWIFGPIVVIHAWVRPGAAWATFVSSAVQVLCIGVIAWLVVRFSRKK